MLYNLTKLESEPFVNIESLHEIPIAFFAGIEESESFGNHLFPEWYEDVCGTFYALERKFISLYDNYKAIENKEIRDLILKAFEVNNKIEELCEISIVDREISKTELPANIAEDLDAIFKQLYDSTLNHEKFREKTNTTLRLYIKQFIRVNKVSLCPFCGIYSFINIEGEARTALDHWLCKTFFPQASVNFNNLVPICEKCNKRPVKGERIILDFPEGEAERSKSFYPYSVHSGFNITFSFDEIPDSSDLTTASFSLALEAVNPVENEIFKNWMSVFNIQERFESFMSESIFIMWDSNLEGYCETNPISDTYRLQEFKEYLENHKNTYYHKNTPGHLLYKSFFDYIINYTGGNYLKSIYDNLESKKDASLED